MIEDQVALARIRTMLVTLVVFGMTFVTMLLLILYFSMRGEDVAGAGGFWYAWTRGAIWFVIFGPIVFGFQLSVIAWLVYWSKRLPPERFPKAGYFFAATAALVCGSLGATYAVNNGLNALGVALMCGFLGLMLSGAVGTTFAAPRDAAKGACVGLVLGAVTCVLFGWLRLQAGRPLWHREAWEAISVWMPLCALLGAGFGIKILRVKRFKRQLAGGRVEALSR